jgi:hypothetical protein
MLRERKFKNGGWRDAVARTKESLILEREKAEVEGLQL